jgi:HAD superfamily hydrolase (TIGR01509 family)
MRVIRAIAFDLEGPIFDFEQLHFNSHIEATRLVLGHEITYEWIIGYVPNAVGGGDPNIALHIARHFRVNGREQELLIHKARAFEERLNDHPIKAREGAIETIDWFRERGYPIAIGSNTPREAAMRYLTTVGLGDGTIPIVLAEDVKNPKPWPDIYLKTAEVMGVDPSAQLVFDDSHTGLDAASRAGSPRIATPLHRAPLVMEKLEQHTPLRVIHSWNEINLETLMDHIERELQDV